MWWHNNRWQNTIEKGEKVPLDTPSIFKIVVDSGHPYHGRVVPSEVNDLFFQKTNGGEYPEHVTLVPVLAQDRAVALLMGTCSQDTGSHLVLSRLENDAQTFATALMRVKSIAKKAG